MTRYNGQDLKQSQDCRYDVVIIGSGPAGASNAAVLAKNNLRVAIVEEGNWVEENADFKNLGNSFNKYYRDSGTSALIGSPPIPYLQGKTVGGSSTINGAISWRLPEDVHASWLKADPALAESIPWERICEITDAIEQRLNIQPTPPEIAGPRNLLMKKGADALGLENRPISRNVRNCRSSGLCLHACPNQAKQSMDKSYLLDAEADGADIFSGYTAHTLLREKNIIQGVKCTSASGNLITLKAKHIVLAASAIQSPALLIKNKIKQGPVGKHFQCHPGISVSGMFPEEIHNWHDATQGHEVIGLRKEGIKFESAAMDISVFGMRMPGAGQDFMQNLQKTRRCADWAAAIKSDAHGQVHYWGGNTLVRWSPSKHDMLLFRRAAYTLGRMFFAAGAESVNPGVYPWPRAESLQALQGFEHKASLNPKHYNFAVTHMFGTCRMGSDPANSVVGPDFQHHHIKGLYIADSSVFPSNTGVNPQTSILALSQICASHILESLN